MELANVLQGRCWKRQTSRSVTPTTAVGATGAVTGTEVPIEGPRRE